MLRKFVSTAKLYPKCAIPFSPPNNIVEHQYMGKVFGPFSVSIKCVLKLTDFKSSLYNCVYRYQL